MFPRAQAKKIHVYCLAYCSEWCSTVWAGKEEKSTDLGCAIISDVHIFTYYPHEKHLCHSIYSYQKIKFTSTESDFSNKKEKSQLPWESQYKRKWLQFSTLDLMVAFTSPLVRESHVLGACGRSDCNTSILSGSGGNRSEAPRERASFTACT